MTKTFEKLFIKFEEGNQASLDRAVAEAERLGYKKWDYEYAISFRGNGILKLNKYGEYLTTNDTKEELIEEGYKEHLIPTNPNTITVDGKEYRYVYVSDESVEDALERKEKRIFLCELPGDTMFKYLCVGEHRKDNFINGEEYDYTYWRHIAEIPIEEEKERTIKCTDEKWEEIKNILGL